ncbi:NYN domain-containing protein [Kitasatospora cineracea]|uniref:NYN domain-containing protein n=1 Tax=Kitasatospora cineracea TaxID=88074 RepID=UPI0033CA6677
MRVGVYVDAFNLYYGGRSLCSRGTAGWRWLDVRSLSTSLVAASTGWPSASLDRVVYCTARIDAATNASGHRDQDIYLKALVASGSVDHIEYGKYAYRVKVAPLATKDARGKPQLVTPNWPIMIQDGGTPIQSGVFMASVAQREEKGSDVNVASHLLLDVLGGKIDAAVVISNDSDLSLPLREARQRVPVGLVNPSKGRLAGDLRGTPTEGVGSHWWHQLSALDFHRHQLPDPVGRYVRPIDW